MLISSRQNGAVQLMLLIMVLVLAIIGWALWFMQYTENEDLKKAEQSASDDAGFALEAATRYRAAFETFAQKVGGVPASVPEFEEGMDFTEYNQVIDNQFVQPIETQIDAARNLFDGDASMTVLYDVVTPAEQMVNKLQGEITRLENELATARSERDAAQAASNQMVSDHNTELQRRTNEAAQAQQRALAKEQQLEAQKNDLAGKLSDSTDRYEQTLTRTRREVTELTATMEKLDRQVADVKRNLRISQERKRPDGRVIDVNYKTGMCWINLGSKDVLRRGTRFRTYGFLKGGVRDYHGYIVVRDLERDRALCALEGGAQPRAGDFITNPYYDAEETETFYFLGKLPGRFDNQRAQAILEDFNAEVVETFSPRVDFLVIGANPDPEAVGENADPNWFKKTVEYNDAIRWNIEMMRAEDLEVFLQY